MTSFLHIDMDAFFAAVEALDHPDWKGKPIIVGADPRGGRGRGVVSTASYEARRFGVGSAMPISQAWKRCPQGIYVPPRMGRYTEISAQIMEIFGRFTPQIQPLSLDEAFLDVTGSIRLFGDPVRMAEKIKATVCEETGLTCSVGVSSVKSVAKVASDRNKPDGITVVPGGAEETFLAPLGIRTLWGIGPKAAAVLARIGVSTVGDLQKRSQRELIRLFGKAGGKHYWNMAHAVDHREVCDDEELLSISHETTFIADVEDNETLSRTLLWLADKVASRLRIHGVTGRVVTLKYRTEDFKTYTRRKTLASGIADTQPLYETARALMQSLRGKNRKVRLLGVGLTRLEAARKVQLSLFDSHKKFRDHATEEAIDRVRKRFGKAAIVRGSLLDGTETTERSHR